MLLYSWCLVFNAVAMLLFSMSKSIKGHMRDDPLGLASTALIVLSGPLFTMFSLWIIGSVIVSNAASLPRLAFLMVENTWLRLRLRAKWWAYRR